MHHDESYYSKAFLRQYMKEHSLKGALFPMAKERQPFIGEIVPFISPSDPEVTFGLRRLDNRAVMQYRDANSAVRYIMEEGNDRVITEKDYPMGTMRRDVVKLGLATWNITNDGKPVPIDEETILQYLNPLDGELDAVYEEIMRINPILVGAGTERKKS